MAEGTEPEESRSSMSVRMWLIAAALAAVVLVLLCTFVLPEFLAPGRSAAELAPVRDQQERLRLEDDRDRLRNEVRATLVTACLQAIGGLLLAAGAIAAWRQLRLTQHTHELAQEQLRVSEEGQITERFTRAIEQLGDENTDVRLGGIYALERIAHNSPPDRQPIYEIFTAFVRNHLPWPPPNASDTAQELDALPWLRNRAPDVQAAMTALGRRAPVLDRPEDLLLSRVDLRKAHLVKFDLHGAFFRHSNLAGSTLMGADLRDTEFTDGSLAGANLQGALLQGALLEQARLDGANLYEALADATTCWPQGFDWRAAGVVVEDSRH
jgi:pentapeptide repeat protein